tara:strand:+ start:293 stop:706 length:414 start_codon:yes stop_codon:yes gene_type:complete
MTYKHEIRVRYGECDQQGVAFNANYMVWMDDATEVWTRTLIGDKDYRELGWEWMVVRSAIEWHASARNADLLSIDIGVTRFGSSSFDFGFIGTVRNQPIFKAISVCVSVKPVTLEKLETPVHIREMLGPVVEWDIPS